MKKLAIVLILVTANVVMVKAQRLASVGLDSLRVKPEVGSVESLTGLNTKNPVDPLKYLLPQKNYTAKVLARAYDDVVYSTMTIAGMGSRQQDNIPTASLASSMQYNMPVKRMAIVNPLKNTSTAKP